MYKSTQVRRFLKRDRDERGVASTVGTIMALLVFLTFLTLFTNSYVPVWMIDNERSHMNTVMNQFGEMKGKADLMTLTAYLSGMTNLNMYQSIDLGSDGIPVFAMPTAGFLTYQPYSIGTSYTNVNFTYDVDESQEVFNQTGGGMIQFYAPNRYYVQQWVTFENNAIVVRQEDGQAMKAFPSLELMKTEVGSLIDVTFTQIDFIGQNSSVGGTFSASVNIDLIFFESQQYIVSNDGTDPIPVVMSFTTPNPDAWLGYLDEMLSETGSLMTEGVDYDLAKLADGKTVVLTILRAGYFTFNHSIMEATLQAT